MSNPYQGFFDKLDKTIEDLPSGTDQAIDDAIDLLRRAGFFLVNHLNTTVELAQHLVLPEEQATEPTKEPEGTSVEDVEQAQEGPNDVSQ